MKWWKCEECKGEAPCFLATLESCNEPMWCPWASDLDEDGDLEAQWVECSPAPHEPTRKEGLQVEDDRPDLHHYAPFMGRDGDERQHTVLLPPWLCEPEGKSK